MAEGAREGRDGIDPRTPGPSVAEALAEATRVLAEAGAETPRLDAEVLFAHAAGGVQAGWDATRLIRDAREVIDPSTLARFREALRRRAAREPVAYITGAREFWSRRFRADPRVLVPRPETETVVEEALRVIQHLSPFSDGRTANGLPGRIVDVGTGSGVIAIALACELGGPEECEILAIDRSAAALAVACENARALLARDERRPRWMRGDLTTSLAPASAALVVANPPYLSRAELEAAPPELRYEPFEALVAGGDDGLGVLRELIQDAFRVLCPGGFLVSEIGSSQAAKVASLARERGFEEVAVHRDLAGRDRVLTARRPASPRELIQIRDSDEERGEEGWTRSSFEEGAGSRERFASAAPRTPPSRSSSRRS